MPDPSELALYFVAALLLAVSPGPGIFYVAARTLAGGRGDGVASCFGTALGGTVHIVAGSLGVSAIVLASAGLFTALTLAGAVYLIWLGTRPVRAARRDASAGLPGAAAPASGPRRAFREGVLVEAMNPKTAGFFLAFIPQFVDPAHGSVALQFLVLGAVSIVLNALADIGVVLAASGLRRGAAAHPSLIRRLRIASGVGMVALGIGLAFADRPGA
jgi:threonine/homoserine/homoserine lactone efflux protein